jgi:hypothetical protein
MPANLVQLRVDGLTPLQLAELRSAVASTGIDAVTALEGTNLVGGKLGEPTTLSVVITLAPAIIAAVALWIAKQKKRRTSNIRYTKIDPNGSMEFFEIDESSYEEGATSSAAIQTYLEKKLGYDPTATG